MRDNCSHDLLNAGWNTFWQHYEKKSITRNFAEKVKIPAVDTKCQSNDQQLARFCNACVLHLLVYQERYFVVAAQKSTILHALASTNVVCNNKRQSWVYLRVMRWFVGRTITARNAVQTFEQSTEWTATIGAHLLCKVMWKDQLFIYNKNFNQ